MSNDQWRDKNILYVLTVSGDLATYYDAERGEGAFDALTPDQQQTLVTHAERALGYSIGESLDIAFDYAVETFEEERGSHE